MKKRHSAIGAHLCVLLSLCLGLSACRSTAPIEPSDQPSSAAADSVSADTDAPVAAAESTTYSASTFPALTGSEGFSDSSEFTPAGEIHALLDLATIDGYSSADGYYRFVPRPDGSSNLCYIDFASQKQIYLCSQPNCDHSGDTCASWYPSNMGILLPIPVGDQVVILHGGSSYTTELGDAALAQIETIAPDGSGRTSVAQFPASVSITAMPRGGYAYDDENVYFVLSTAGASGLSRTLCAVNAPSGKLYALYDLPDPEEKIVGGVGSCLLLSASAGAYDMGAAAEELSTQYVLLDPIAQTITPLFSAPYLAVGGIWNGTYALLTPSATLATYDLQSGSLLSEQPVSLPENFSTQSMHGDGLFDGKILVHAFQNDVVDENGLSPLIYCAVDVSTGEVIQLEQTYQTELSGNQPCTIVAETADNFLFAYTDRSLELALPNGMAASYNYYQYALLPKADFWNNSGEPVVIGDQ